MTIEQAYQTLYGGALIVLILLIGAMVIRSIIGPRSTDRIMSVNMLGTMTICSIAILSVLLDEGYLADVALIYAMISFVAVLMMASMFVPSRPKAPKLDEEPVLQGSGGQNRDSPIQKAENGSDDQAPVPGGKR